MKLAQVKRLKERRKENAQLMKAEAELPLDKLILEEAAEGGREESYEIAAHLGTSTQSGHRRWRHGHWVESLGVEAVEAVLLDGALGQVFIEGSPLLA